MAWYPGEPSNSSEDCAHLSQSQGFSWNDVDCLDLYYPICNGIGIDESYTNGKYFNVWIEQPDQYIFIPTQMTWNNANTYCFDNYGTSLATIISDSDFIVATMTRYNVNIHIMHGLIK